MQITSFHSVEDNASGTTGAAYAVAKSIDMTGFRNCLILIKNNDATNTMYYKVDGYAKQAGTLSNPEVVETSLAVSTTVPVVLDGKTRSKYVISVKNNTGVCAFTIEFIKGN